MNKELLAWLIIIPVSVIVVAGIGVASHPSNNEPALTLELMHENGMQISLYLNNSGAHGLNVTAAQFTAETIGGTVLHPTSFPDKPIYNGSKMSYGGTVYLTMSFGVDSSQLRSITYSDFNGTATVRLQCLSD